MGVRLVFTLLWFILGLIGALGFTIIILGLIQFLIKLMIPKNHFFSGNYKKRVLIGTIMLVFPELLVKFVNLFFK